MVFKKRRVSVRRFKRGFRRGGFRSKRLRRTIKRVFRNMVEIKYSVGSTSFNTGTITTNPYVAYLNPDISQGTTKNQRIANRIKYKMATVTFDVWLPSVLGAFLYSGITIRVLILQPRVVFSGIPTATDIFDNTSYLSTVRGTSFRVMYDRLKTLTPQNLSTVSGGDPTHFSRKLHFKLANNVNFKLSTDVQPTDPKDQYYFVLTSSLQGLTSIAYGYQGNHFMRISFIDV